MRRVYTSSETDSMISFLLLLFLLPCVAFLIFEVLPTEYQLVRGDSLEIVETFWILFSTGKETYQVVSYQTAQQVLNKAYLETPDHGLYFENTELTIKPSVVVWKCDHHQYSAYGVEIQVKATVISEKFGGLGTKRVHLKLPNLLRLSEALKAKPLLVRDPDSCPKKTFSNSLKVTKITVYSSETWTKITSTLLKTLGKIGIGIIAAILFLIACSLLPPWRRRH